MLDSYIILLLVTLLPASMAMLNGSNSQASNITDVPFINETHSPNMSSGILIAIVVSLLFAFTVAVLICVRQLKKSKKPNYAQYIVETPRTSRSKSMSAYV